MDGDVITRDELREEIEWLRAIGAPSWRIDPLVRLLDDATEGEGR